MSSISTSNSGQKFIARNRAPRVQIDYDVEIYGSEKKIQIPFVMGVMADLSGKPTESLPDIGDRKFLDISVDNFDARMKSVKPQGVVHRTEHADWRRQLWLWTLTFESMDDFSPASIARRIGALNTLLEARTQLHNLLSYMDGKQGAEELIAKVLKDPALLGSLAASAKPATPAEGSSAADKPAA